MTPLVAAPIILTLTLVVSGIAKLPARAQTVDAMTSLRIPFRRLHPLAAVAVPAAELIAAVLLWVPWVSLQTVVSVGVAVLMATYLVIIARALTFDEEVECSCFGTIASPTVSRTTLLRNILLTLTGVLGVVAAATGQIAVAVSDGLPGLLGWAIALGVTALITVCVMGGVKGSGAGSGAGGDTAAPGGADLADGDVEELDYERTPIPFGALTRQDGTTVTLKELTAERAVLLLLLSYGCGPCVRVLDEIVGWREKLGGMVHVQVVYLQKLENLPEAAIERAGGDPLNDPEANVQRVFGLQGTPSAILLGADGMTAGGPVAGGGDVIEFAEEIIEQIHGAIADGELQVAVDAVEPSADDRSA